MFKAKSITNDIYYVGVNDRQKLMFENQIPLPFGVSYNSYVIVDEKIALIDTVEIPFAEIYIDKLLDVLRGRSVDYLIINHMEPDHSGSIRAIKRLFPDVKIIGNARTFKMLAGYYGIEDGLMEVTDGSTISLGKHELKFFLTPMIHWPETMMTYDASDKAIFTGDAFGAFGALDGGVVDADLMVNKYLDEFDRYFSNIAGKYGSPVQKALEKMHSVQIDYICPTHGPVWREQIPKIIDMTNSLSRYEGKRGVVIVYASMYGNTEQMAEAIAEGLSESGEKNIMIYDVAKTDASFILTDIFRYDRLVMGSPTYNNGLFPEMASFLLKIENRDIKHRKFSYFGSSTWSNATMRIFAAFAEKMKWEVIGTAVEEQQSLKENAYKACIALGKELAKA
ncbi:FprA family A-type flavoprotein [Microbacter margulisiae]|uniref:Flavorubredoxin n=1 Tax=Microbacter margulisiae TaxID=1350067 RepID=A0A7W5H1G4_9PORP|nr:FprA family A-type flavoprotein [Microbacter margulisiae]MBB3186680.1 flavorubredoxin [Microbacter margulisiae]